MRKTKGINTLFLKKSRKNKAFFDKNRGKSPSLSEDFDQFSDSGDAAFCVHLSDYQTIAILVIDGYVVIVVIWSFVKIENGCGQNRHYNIKIYFYIIVSRKCVFQIENDKWPNDQNDRNVKKDLIKTPYLFCLKILQGIIREPQQMLHNFAAKKVMANLVRMNEEYDEN